MLRSNLRIFVGILSLFVGFSTYAKTTVTTTTTTTKKHVIVTPPPKSLRCTTIAGHWEEHDVWVDKQVVCRYKNRTEGVAWVQDYWACTEATDAGDCTFWEFRPGHWVQSLD